MTKLSTNMARTLLTAALVGGEDESGGRGVPAVEALEKRGFVKITRRGRSLTNLVWFEVTDLGLEAAVELETQGLAPYGQPVSLGELKATWKVTV
jgi:hypothetical protein